MVGLPCREIRIIWWLLWVFGIFLLIIVSVIMQFAWCFSCWDNLEDGFQYKISNSVLEIVTCHKDLGLSLIHVLSFIVM